MKIQLTRWRKRTFFAPAPGAEDLSGVRLDLLEDSASEARFVEMLRRLNAIPGLEEYCVVDKFSSVVCSRGRTWGKELERGRLSLMEL